MHTSIAFYYPVDLKLMPSYSYTTLVNIISIVEVVQQRPTTKCQSSTNLIILMRSMFLKKNIENELYIYI